MRSRLISTSSLDRLSVATALGKVSVLKPSEIPARVFSFFITSPVRTEKSRDAEKEFQANSGESSGTSFGFRDRFRATGDDAMSRKRGCEVLFSVATRINPPGVYFPSGGLSEIQLRRINSRRRRFNIENRRAANNRPRVLYGRATKKRVSTCAPEPRTKGRRPFALLASFSRVSRDVVICRSLGPAGKGDRSPFQTRASLGGESSSRRIPRRCVYRLLGTLARGYWRSPPIATSCVCVCVQSRPKSLLKPEK